MIQIQRWTSNIDILTGDSIVFLLAESLADIPKRLLGCAQLGVLEIPRPKIDERFMFVQKFGLDDVPFADEITPKLIRGGLCRFVFGTNSIVAQGELEKQKHPYLSQW